MKAMRGFAFAALCMCAALSYGVQVDEHDEEVQRVEAEVAPDDAEQRLETPVVKGAVGAGEEQNPTADSEESNGEKGQVVGPELSHISTLGPWSWDWDRVFQAAGIIGLLVVIWQTYLALGKARRANEIARGVADVSIRPWLQIRSEEAKSDLEWSYGGPSLSVLIPVENIGQTPALNVTATSRLIVTSEEARTDERFGDWCDQQVENRAQFKISDIFPTTTANLPEEFRVYESEVESSAGPFERRGNLPDARIEFHLFVCITYTAMSDPNAYYVTAHSSRVQWSDPKADYSSFFFEVGDDFPQESLLFARGSNSRVT